MSRLENQSRNRSMDKGEARDSGCRQDETGRSDGRPRPSAALADGSATKVHGGSWASRGEGKVGSGERHAPLRSQALARTMRYAELRVLRLLGCCCEGTRELQVASQAETSSQQQPSMYRPRHHGSLVQEHGLLSAPA